MSRLPIVILAAAISSVRAEDQKQTVPPDKIRPWAERHWRETMTPAKPKRLPAPPAAEKASVELKDETLRLRAPVASDLEPDINVVKANKDGTFSDGAAGGRLQWFSTVYAASRPEKGLTEKLPELPAKFFDAALQAIPDDRLAASGVPDSLRMQSPWQSGGPLWMCKVKLDGYTDVAGIRASLFDLRTHCRLSFGGTWGPEVKDGLIRGADAWCWHKTPVRIVIDFSHGPLEERTVDPAAGVFDLPSGVRVQILAVADGRYKGSVDPWDDKTKEFTATWKKDADGDGKMTTLAWAVYPRRHLLDVVFSAVLDDGSVVQGSEPAGSLTPCVFKAPLKRIKSIKIGCRQHRKRVLFDLPYLPGLPATNDSITDLLDVKIPWLALQPQTGLASSELCQFLQLRWGSEVHYGFIGSWTDATLRTITSGSAASFGLKWEIDSERFQLKMERK